jgi:hypothetical protein
MDEFAFRNPVKNPLPWGGRGIKPANSLNGSEKWMSLPSETLLRTLSLGEGEEESLQIALMVLKNG